jgi:riboflavin synthase
VFTGIIEQAGAVTAIEAVEGGASLQVAAENLDDRLREGDSVAVNGVCLTVVELTEGGTGMALRFQAVAETLRRSNLGDLRVGDRVNLERPLRAGGRLDGHIVQGHVDGVCRLASVEPEGNSYRIRFAVPPDLLRYVVEKGSIALDGISLTVAAVGADWLEVAIIPHTWQVTNLHFRKPGDRINLEVDILAKYVERLLGGFLPPNARSGTDRSGTER